MGAAAEGADRLGPATRERGAANPCGRLVSHLRLTSYWLDIEMVDVRARGERRAWLIAIVPT